MKLFLWESIEDYFIDRRGIVVIARDLEHALEQVMAAGGQDGYRLLTSTGIAIDQHAPMVLFYKDDGYC